MRIPVQGNVGHDDLVEWLIEHVGPRKKSGIDGNLCVSGNGWKIYPSAIDFSDESSFGNCHWLVDIDDSRTGSMFALRWS